MVAIFVILLMIPLISVHTAVQLRMKTCFIKWQTYARVPIAPKFQKTINERDSQ